MTRQLGVCSCGVSFNKKALRLSSKTEQSGAKQSKAWQRSAKRSHARKSGGKKSKAEQGICFVMDHEHFLDFLARPVLSRKRTVKMAYQFGMPSSLRLRKRTVKMRIQLAFLCTRGELG